MTRNTFKIFALVFGGIALAGSLFGLYWYWSQPVTIGWTPKHLALPVTSFADRVEVNVVGTPLATAIAEKRLYYAGGDDRTQNAPVTDADVTVSFNNYFQVRSSRIPMFTGLAAVAGASGVLFLLGIFAPAGLMRTDAGKLTELHLLEEA
jgi:hypothetical protein